MIDASELYPTEASERLSAALKQIASAKTELSNCSKDE